VKYSCGFSSPATKRKYFDQLHGLELLPTVVSPGFEGTCISLSERCHSTEIEIKRNKGKKGRRKEEKREIRKERRKERKKEK
jgi:hypothetical protein